VVTNSGQSQAFVIYWSVIGRQAYCLLPIVEGSNGCPLFGCFSITEGNNKEFDSMKKAICYLVLLLLAGE